MATDFPRLLKSWRERYGLSQFQLSELIGVDHSYCSRLESGTRHPSRATVERLAEALALDDDAADQLMAAAGYASERVQRLVLAGGHDRDGQRGAA